MEVLRERLNGMFEPDMDLCESRRVVKARPEQRRYVCGVRGTSKLYHKFN